MTYRLIRINGDEPTRTVGVHDGYEQALAARADDVLAQLVERGGWRTRIEHVIVGPGVDGPATVHPLCTELGVDPGGGGVPQPRDLDDAREWLTVIHAVR